MGLVSFHQRASEHPFRILPPHHRHTRQGTLQEIYVALSMSMGRCSARLTVRQGDLPMLTSMSLNAIEVDYSRCSVQTKFHQPCIALSLALSRWEVLMVVARRSAKDGILRIPDRAS